MADKPSLKRLLNEPTLVYDLTPDQAKQIIEQNDEKQVLPHNVLATLTIRANEDWTSASKEEQERVASVAAADPFAKQGAS